MQLTQTLSSEPEVHSAMTKLTGPVQKPKVPCKPSHLTCVHRKCPTLPTEGSNAFVSQTCPSKHVSHRKIVGHDERARLEEKRRRSTNSIVTSKKFANVASSLHFKTPSLEESHEKQRDAVISNCCDFGEYVEINFPAVEPGTRIRTDDFSGEIETIPCCTGSKTPSPPQVRRKPTGRSISDTSLRKHLNKQRPSSDQYEALISELGKKFRSNSLESLKPSSTADESGYEIPLSFQTPTYMCLDDDLGPFAYDETEASEVKPKLSRNKKVRLARFRRKPFNPSSSTPPEEKSPRSSLLASQKSDSEAVPTRELSDETREGFFASPKPLNSFLATRLRSLSSDRRSCHDHHIVNHRTSLSSSTITCSTCESDCSEDEWSDSSEDVLAEYESFYQQITPSRSSRRNCDHPYETIEEYPCRSVSDPCDSSESSEYESVCNECSSSAEAAVFHVINLNSERKLYKKNFQNMKFPDVRDCTWETVSTPGVLKHNELKNMLKLNFNKDPAGNQRS